ncbi:MAG: type 1 glutamine amidotransferase domain-containing protein [Armatimonadota bacterium]
MRSRMIVLTAFVVATCICAAAVADDAKPLEGTTVAVLVAQDFEDSELQSPMQALQDAGAEVVLVAKREGKEYTGKNDEVTVTSDVRAADVSPEQFDGVVVPGGKAPAELRRDPHMTGLVRKMALAGKPVAAICHGPQVLVTARVLDGRKATCYSGVADELEEVGADYRDRAVVVDDNIITSRVPRDLPEFNAALIRALGK